MDEHSKHLAPNGAPVEACTDALACETQQCEVCLKDIPTDTVGTYTQDYIHHFCGLDCLEMWRKRAQALPEKPM